MSKKKWLSLLVAGSMVVSLLASCGEAATETTTSDTEAPTTEDATPAEGTDSEEVVELVWVTQGVGEDAWEGQTVPILEKYNSMGNVNVTGEFYSFGDLFDVIEVKIASGSEDYDVISVDVPMVASYASRELILPMDEYYTEEDKALFAPAGVEAGSYNDMFYAPPMNTSTQVLWYNTALLDEAGVEVPESDTNNRLTWEQVVDLAQQTLDVVDPDGTNGTIGLEFQQVSRVYQMNALPNSMGGANIGDDGFTVDGVINDEAWVNALTWYQGIVNDGIASRGITADEVGDYFNAGRVVFMVGGTWTANTADAAGFTTYGYAPCPAFEGYEDSVGTSTGSWHFGINAASQNVDASADFIKYFTLGEGNDDWLEINGDVPSRIEKLDEIINDADAPGYLKIGAEEAKTTAVPRALTPGFNEYQNILNNTWEDIRNGSDVTASLDGAVQQINTAMEQYK